MSHLGISLVSFVQWLIVVFDLFHHNTPVITTYILKWNKPVLAFFDMSEVEISESDGRYPSCVQIVFIIKTYFHVIHFLVVEQVQWKTEAFDEALRSEPNKALCLVVTLDLIHCKEKLMLRAHFDLIGERLLFETNFLPVNISLKPVQIGL